MAEVWIDRDAGLCKKFYVPDGKTIKGTRPLHTDEETITRLYDREIRWSTTLPQDIIIKLLDHGPLPDRFGYWILQEYVGPDLLYYYSDETRLDHAIPDATEQIIEMYKIFKLHNVYKLNGAMCNLTQRDGRILAFDFKYALERSPDMLQWEIKTIEQWLSKINPKMLDLLTPYL